MKKIIAYLYIFSLLFSTGCQFGVNEKQTERDKTEYDLNYTDWKFIGKDSTELTKSERKENIKLCFETNVESGAVICISKGSGIMAANQNSIPKYDTIKSKNKNIEVGFTSADFGGFIRFRIFPTLHDAEQNNDKLLLDIEYRIDIKKNKEEKVVEPYDLVLTKYVNFQWKKEVKELEADAGILIKEW